MSEPFHFPSITTDGGGKCLPHHVEGTKVIYKRCCGDDCMFKDNPGQDEQPCWGDIGVEGWQDDIAGWVHTCEGHRYIWEGRPNEHYKPEEKSDGTVS